MKNRTASLELLRFLAATAVIFNHFDSFMGVKNAHTTLVAIVVEFFFMITGFFMMKGLTQKRQNTKLTEAFPYVFKKAKSIWGIYFASLCFVFIIRMITNHVTDVSEMFAQLFHFKWEFFMLHMAGFNPNPQFGVDYLSAPTWYISSMFIALIPVYFLASNLGNKFSGIIAPIAMVLIYAYIIKNYQTINVGNEYMGCILLGNVRAFAGISAGAFAFFLSDMAAQNALWEKHRKAGNILNVIAWLSLPCMVLLYNTLAEPDMMVYIFVYMLLLVQGSSNTGTISVFFNTHCTIIWDYLGKLSLYVYLFHIGIVMLWQKYIPEFTGSVGYVAYFAAVMLLSIAVMTCTAKIKVMCNFGITQV